jgi:hypothetical protein
MTVEAIDIDQPAQAPPDAMAALMAASKGKAKAEATAAGLAEKEIKDKEIREGLPW